MIGTMIISPTTGGAHSWWEGKGYEPSIAYTSATTDGVKVTATLSAEMIGATFANAQLTYEERATMGGEMHVRYYGTSTEVSQANLVQHIQASQTIELYFSYKANGGTGGKGVHDAYCTWSNIQITVEYTPPGNMHNSLTITDCGTASYSFDKTNVAHDSSNNESSVLSITASPTVAIKEIKVSIRPGDIMTAGSTFDYTKEIVVSSNLITSFSTMFSISADMKNTMQEGGDRIYNAKIKIDFKGNDTNETIYTSGWQSVQDSVSSDPLKLIKERNAPAISSITWGESGTSHVSTYGGYIAGITIPTLSFNVSFDTQADASTKATSMSLQVGNQSYDLNTANIIIDPLSVGTINYTISVTDNHGKTGINTGSLNSIAYTAPALSNLAINRYAQKIRSDSTSYNVLDDEGTSLALNATIIALSTTVGTGSNNWTFNIKNSNGNSVLIYDGTHTGPITASNAARYYKFNSEDVTDPHDGVHYEGAGMISGSYNNTAVYELTVTLSDSFSSTSYIVTVPKAGGVLSVEQFGVGIGKRSTGTAATKLFESAYEAHFDDVIYVNGNSNLKGVFNNGNIYNTGEIHSEGSIYVGSKRLDADDDTGWKAVTLSNCAIANGYGKCAVRKKNGVCFLYGVVKLSSAMPSSGSNSLTIGTIPSTSSDCFPTYNVLVNSGAKANYSCIEIDTSGNIILWNRIGANISTDELISISAVYLPDIAAP